MRKIFYVIEALEQTREDVSRWLEVINAQNEVDDALSAFLQDLANDTDLSEDKKSKAVELFPYLLFLANSDSITVLVENETAESLQGVNSFLTGKGVGLSFEPAPVPEPATMILLASGLVGLVGLRKTFRK